MPASNTCLKCGQLLADDARQGFCPKCLFLQASTGLFETSGSASLLNEPCAMPFGVPSRFGDYDLLEEIGRGGMGVIYRARQRSLDRLVAIKMMAFGPGASPEFVGRFRAEAVSAASLHHPNIVAIHEVGIHHGQHFFVMDCIEGQSLARLVGSQPLPARRAATYLKTIAGAVHYAHERGILHRDLKPSNVLVDLDDQPRVVDFGLARRLEGESELTVTGQVLGSPNYLPPEQAVGRRARVSRRTDVYSLGATLYHLLTARPPFQAESLAQTLDLVLHSDPVSPRLLNPSVPRDLETICLKCLEKEAARRYPTAQALADELDRFLAGEPIRARPLGPAGKLWRWCRRKPQVAGLSAAAMLSVVLGFGGTVWQLRVAVSERQRAQASERAARRQSYISDINAAQAAIKRDIPERALELLNRHRPKASSLSSTGQQPSTDLRGFEWRHLWEQCKSEAQLVAKLPSGIRSFELSRDGRWMLATTFRGSVHLWNRATGEDIPLRSESGIQAYAAFSPDSRWLLYTDQSMEAAGTASQSAEFQGKISVLNLSTRQHLSPITGPWFAGPMAFTPDGQRVICGCCDVNSRKQAFVLDFHSRTQGNHFEFRTKFNGMNFGYSLCPASDNRRIVFSEIDTNLPIVVWDFVANTRQTLPGHAEPIIAMALSPNGRVLATTAGYSESTIKLWDFPSHQPLGELAGHKQWVAGLCYSPDGETLASASADRTVRLWDMCSLSNKWASRRLPQTALRVRFSADGRELLCALQDGSIYRWDFDSPKPKPRIWLSSGSVEDIQTVAVSPDGSRFAGIRNGVVCLGLAETDAQAVPELGNANTCVRFSADGRWLFAGSWTGDVQKWSVADRKVVHRQHRADSRIWWLGEVPASGLLVVVQFVTGRWEVGYPCRIGIWRIADLQEQRSWKGFGLTPKCAISPSGQWLALADDFGPLRVWDATDASREVRALAAGWVNDVAFSPDGRFMAASNSEGMVHVWEIPAFRVLRAFRAHRGMITGLAFSPDCQRLATSGEDAEAIKLWDVATWQELITLERPSEVLGQISFSDSGRQITAFSLKGDGTQGDVLFWRVPSLGEIEADETSSGSAPVSGAPAGVSPTGRTPAELRLHKVSP